MPVTTVRRAGGRRWGAPRRMWRKKKFLRKYRPLGRSLGNPLKVYAFKRAGEIISLANNVAGEGAITLNGPDFFTGAVQADFGKKYYAFPISQQFALQDVTAVNEFRSLFDNYKISGVKLKIYWLNNSAMSAPDVASLRPMLTYYTDDDDSDVPSSLDVCRQRNNVKSHVFGSNKPLIIYIKPMVAKMVYNSPTATAYGPGARQWLDCTNATVPHYGLKGWFSNVLLPEGVETTCFRIEPTYYLKMRGVQ